MGPFVMNTKREVLQAFEDFQKGLLGSIPAIYKEDAKPKAPLQRTDKLQGDAPARGASDSVRGASDSRADVKAADILDVHCAPTEMHESGDN